MRIERINVMAEISLVVTKRVIDHISGGNENQSQIAIRIPSEDIKPILSQLTANNRMTIILGGYVRLIVGDIGAIWLAHNSSHADDFMSLFTLLSRRPGKEMRFLCELE